MKSEVLVKATAELAQEVLEKDLRAPEKNLGDLINATAIDNNRRTVHRSVPESGGENQAKV
jgi:hypothetical protein